MRRVALWLQGALAVVVVSCAVSVAPREVAVMVLSSCSIVLCLCHADYGTWGLPSAVVAVVVALSPPVVAVVTVTAVVVVVTGATTGTMTVTVAVLRTVIV